MDASIQANSQKNNTKDIKLLGRIPERLWFLPTKDGETLFVVFESAMNVAN